MNWPVVGVGIAIVAFVVARIWVRRWIVRNWLDDTLTDRQAAALLFVTQYSPMILFIGMVLISSPESLPPLLLIILFVAPTSIAFWGALMDYIVHHGVKEKLQADRQARLERTDR